MHLGAYDEALKTSTDAIKQLKNKNEKLTPIFYVTAGIVEKIKGNTENACKLFNQAINIYDLRLKNNNDDKDAIMNKALTLCYLDKKSDALVFLNSLNQTKDNKMFIEENIQNINEFKTDEFLKKIKENKW